jgi:hypothetical protein
MNAGSPTRDIAALIALIEARSALRFRWTRGRECVGFSGACAHAQTGVDPLAGLPSWRTRREALAVADAEGGLEAAVDRRLARIAPAMAQRGDIAGVPASGSDRRFGIRLMVVEGDTLVAPGARGLERLPRAAMKMAWSITEARADG